jgi:Protein of unknown function (DUF1580)
MLDLVGGPLISFQEAASHLPACRKGRPVHASTLHRWRAKGLRGVRLPARRIGGVWMTSLAALDWFVERLTCGEPGPPASNDAGAASHDALEAGGW